MIRIIADTIEYDRRPVAKITVPDGSLLGSFLEDLERAMAPEPAVTYATDAEHDEALRIEWDSGHAAGKGEGEDTGYERCKEEYAALVEAAQAITRNFDNWKGEPGLIQAIANLYQEMTDLGL